MTVPQPELSHFWPSTLATYWIHVTVLRDVRLTCFWSRLLHILRKFVRPFVHESGIRSRQTRISVKKFFIEGPSTKVYMFYFYNHQHTKTFNTNKATKNHLVAWQYFIIPKVWAAQLIVYKITCTPQLEILFYYYYYYPTQNFWLAVKKHHSCLITYWSTISWILSVFRRVAFRAKIADDGS